MSKKLTWGKLTKLEPELIMLETMIKREAPTRDDEGERYFCANNVWYEKYKPILLRLIGKYREDKLKYNDPYLKTSNAYDTAYTHLYNLLPDCCNCSCISTEDLMHDMADNVIHVVDVNKK